MPGMNSGLNPADPTIVNAFRSALLHQWLIAAAIFVLLLLVWGTTRAWTAVPVTGGEGGAPVARRRRPRPSRGRGGCSGSPSA